MGLVNIGLLQMMTCGCAQAGEAFCRRAKEMGADIALFPEMWNIGYSFPESSESEADDTWRVRAVGPQVRFATHFMA